VDSLGRVGAQFSLGDVHSAISEKVRDRLLTGNGFSICVKRNFITDCTFYKRLGLFANGKVVLLNHALGNLWVTYALYLYLVRKFMVDCLLLIIELFR